MYSYCYDGHLLYVTQADSKQEALVKIRDSIVKRSHTFEEDELDAIKEDLRLDKIFKEEGTDEVAEIEI